MPWLKASAAADRFKTLKVECVYDYKFVDQQEAATTVFEYIEIWRPPRGTTEKESILHWDIEHQPRWKNY